MIDINAAEFIKTFDPKNATIGVVGHGYVGQAVEAFFKDVCNVVVHDKAKPDLSTLNDVVARSEVIFVCVPTPMKNDGSCHTGIVEDVLRGIRASAKEIGRNKDSFICVIKSTVPASFTEKMQDELLPMRIVFSPEFLTEKSSISDFKKTNRIVLGGDSADALVVAKYFESVQPDRVLTEKLAIIGCDATVAEMVKLYTNGILMTKVLFANEIYQICQRLGVDYEEVRQITMLDPRIGSGHTKVPGHDGQLGAGGHCFPKDINNLRALCRELGVNEKIFTAVIERNVELREDKDWERMKDRAVIDL